MGIVLFGGIRDGRTMKDILIWNIQSMTFRSSKACCPDSARCVAMLSTDNYDKTCELKIYGFLRKCWSLEGLRDVMFLSVDLIKMIESFMYYDGTVYLITMEQNEENWVIPLHNILT